MECVSKRASDDCVAESAKAPDRRGCVKLAPRCRFTVMGLVMIDNAESTDMGVAEKEMSPWVSIVIATMDSERTLAACLESISSQSLTELEVLVSDGGSRDGTLQIVDRYNHLIKHVRSGADQGVYDAWNKGLPFASAPWVLFLGSDDRIATPDALMKARNQLSMRSEQTGFVAFPTRMREATNRVFVPSEGEVARRRSKGEMPILHTGTLHHRSLFKRFGHFDPTFHISGDYEFVLRCASAQVCVFDAPTLVEFSNGGLSTQRRNIVRILKEDMRARRLHGWTNWTPERVAKLTYRAVRLMLGLT